MSEMRPEVMDFLLTRRSRPAKTIVAPYPERDDLLPLLEAAGRVPDHGKLEPWRFMVLQGDALSRLADLTAKRGGELQIDPDKLQKNIDQFASAGLIVAVVASPEQSEKVPEFEQILSVGASCLSLLNAALASGWAANWLSGWMALDREFLDKGLGLAENEFVAGFVVIGSESVAPPERPRPDMDKKTEWVSE